MGHADSPARSNFAPRSWRREKGSVVGRNEKRICPQDRSTDHAQLRSPQYRRWRRGPFAQARGRAVGRAEEIVGEESRTFATVIDHRYNLRDAREHGIQFEPG